jgi:hypothetical protein
MKKTTEPSQLQSFRQARELGTHNSEKRLNEKPGEIAP